MKQAGAVSEQVIRYPPETVLGIDAESGETITAGCHGVVEAVGFMGGEHVLSVIIRACDS